MTDKKPTVEDCRKIVEEADANTIGGETDPTSGIRMKAQEPDKSVLTYDPNDVEVDEKVRKEAERSRKADK